eukprot:490446-Pelagomonas_calceolata.AAC.1
MQRRLGLRPQALSYKENDLYGRALFQESYETWAKAAARFIFIAQWHARVSRLKDTELESQGAMPGCNRT